MISVTEGCAQGDTRHQLCPPWHPTGNAVFSLKDAQTGYTHLDRQHHAAQTLAPVWQSLTRAIRAHPCILPLPVLLKQPSIANAMAQGAQLKIDVSTILFEHHS
eukprot:3387254-Amphidinium_carterae.1